MSSHQYETNTRHRERQHRYSTYSEGSTHIQNSVASDESRSVNYLASHLKQTASFDYNQNRNSYHNEKENEKYLQHQYEKGSRHTRHSDILDQERASLENNYSRAMSQMNRGDYGPVRKDKKSSKSSSSSARPDEDFKPRYRNQSNGMNVDRRASQSTATTSVVSSASTSKPVPIQVKKRSVSKKDPSEEIIAVFGAYGVTGQYFLQRAMEAGYNVKAMILPGMEMEDVSCSKSLRLITGTLHEVEKIREVVDHATYVVCLLNDCDHENFNPPIGNEDDANYDFNNLNFMHNLVPILQDSVKCRVLLYEASSLSKGDQGTPLLSTVVKKMAISKDWRGKKKEQDKIVKYLMHETKNAHFNYIITRPSGVIWDRPSRKKLAASKSQPGPFPITNSDLAEFTLSALKMEKVYNSCPFVVQDGI